MKTWGQLWPAICSMEALRSACAAAARGKRHTPPAAAYLFNEERHLRRLLGELQARTWVPPAARILLIREPKPRAITVAPFESRVVHHALCDVMEPLLARSYIHTSFACMAGRGSHRAVLAHAGMMCRHRYLMQVDIRKFFPSIPQDRLMAALARKLREDNVLWLCSTILAADVDLYLDPHILGHLSDPHYLPARGKGLPVGHLTSQVFANFYLNPLDHFIKRGLKVKGYLRYIDNLTLFGNTRSELKTWLKKLDHYVTSVLGLEIRHDRVEIRPCSARVDYLGYRVGREGQRVSQPTLHRFARKVVRLSGCAGPGAQRHLKRAITSWRGLLTF